MKGFFLIGSVIVLLIVVGLYLKRVKTMPSAALKDAAENGLQTEVITKLPSKIEEKAIEAARADEERTRKALEESN